MTLNDPGGGIKVYHGQEYVSCDEFVHSSLVGISMRSSTTMLLSNGDSNWCDSPQLGELYLIEDVNVDSVTFTVIESPTTCQDYYF